MKSILSLSVLSVLIATCAHLVSSGPIAETGLAVRSAGEVATYFDQHEFVKRLSAAVYTGTLNYGTALTAGVCAAAFTSAGVAVPASIACPIFAVATLAYTIWAHFQTITSPKMLKVRTLDGERVPNGLWDMVHLYPGNAEHSRPLDHMRSAYNGTQRILAAHHPCSVKDCYNVFYDNHYDDEGDLVHHLAIEPRGDWNIGGLGGDRELDKRSEDVEGPERNHGVETHTSKGVAFFADYDFFDNAHGVEHAFGQQGHEALKKDFMRGKFDDKSDLHHEGYFCMNWSDEGSSVAGTKGLYWQSEKYHMADPDSQPAREKRCKQKQDP